MSYSVVMCPLVGVSYSVVMCPLVGVSYSVVMCYSAGLSYSVVICPLVGVSNSVVMCPLVGVSYSAVMCPLVGVSCSSRKPFGRRNSPTKCVNQLDFLSIKPNNMEGSCQLKKKCRVTIISENCFCWFD